MACEGISNIAAKALEDSRLGISPLEKSTRYVVFNRKLDGRYRYAREPQIMASHHAARHKRPRWMACSIPIRPCWSRRITAVRARTPRDEGTSERVQYAVPMAFRVRWRIKLNLRAAYHLAELRSAPQGHPAYGESPRRSARRFVRFTRPWPRAGDLSIWAIMSWSGSTPSLTLRPWNLLCCAIDS